MLGFLPSPLPGLDVAGLPAPDTAACGRARPARCIPSEKFCQADAQIGLALTVRKPEYQGLPVYTRGNNKNNPGFREGHQGRTSGIWPEKNQLLANLNQHG